MPPMKRLLAATALLLAACATQESADTPLGVHCDSACRFACSSDDEYPGLASNVSSENVGTEAALAPELDSGQPITIDFVNKQPIAGWKRVPGLDPVPGLERMPFGRGMFGPWDAEGPDQF